VLRFLLWRLLGLGAGLAALGFSLWLIDGGAGRALRAKGTEVRAPSAVNVLVALEDVAGRTTHDALAAVPLRLAVALGAIGLLIVLLRLRTRRRRRYVRLRVVPYRTDVADLYSLTRMFAALQSRLCVRWSSRLLDGQPSIALEAHHLPAGANAGAHAWLAVCCPAGLQASVEAALQVAYPNLRLETCRQQPGPPPRVLRLRKQRPFVERATGAQERFEREPEPMMDRLLSAMGAAAEPAFVQLALTPAATGFESFARWLYKRHESHTARASGQLRPRRERSLVEELELRGGLELQHRGLFFADIRVVAPSRGCCEQIAAVLRAERGENRLVARTSTIRALGAYDRRIARGEGNPVPGFLRGVFATNELAALWQLPSIDFTRVPLSRSGLPLSPAPPEVLRPIDRPGTLRDAIGPVSIHVSMRRQNTAVPGTVEQGKSSYLVATVAEDLLRERCAVIVLDPKGDAADAALSAVPPERTCTLLDFAAPSCGFNPLAVDAPPDVIADYVVAALKNLFTDADIRASSDRYLRNAIIAVLAHDRRSTMWDAARLLSVGEEGYAYRRLVGSSVRALPELKEISQFFTSELAAQLADARSATTSKLDAPVNKLARLLNSASIKRVLLNDSLRVDLDRLIAGGEVLVVKGALGSMGAGNTSVLMQLLMGMLDAALARQQDLLPGAERIAVALKVDEAPLVINRGFAETMALKRSAGLETVACWQTDSQWADREVREQLDGLFAHRVYFATASTRDARAAVSLTMAEFSDTVRPGTGRLSALGRPDVRLRLPKHHAIVSWCTPAGRQTAFVAETLPMRVDRARLAHHAKAQYERGGRPLSDMRQPHWEEQGGQAESPPDTAPGGPPAGARPAGPGLPALPDTAAESYRELAALDGATRLRRVPRSRATELAADPLDLEILLLLAELGSVLSSQIHRRFNPGRAATTTQRRLKRLADGGLTERFQFHQPDGGGAPMGYSISGAGRRLLEEQGHELEGLGGDRRQGAQAGAARSGLDRARHEVHVAAWTLALMALAGTGRCRLWGRDRSVLQPPRSRTPQGGPLGPGTLVLPGGRVAHDFLHRRRDGELVEAERFETLRPDAIVGLAAAGREPGLDVLIERDERTAAEGWAAKLERYDHFVSGWSAHTSRYGTGGRALPLVVFLCADRPRARAAARRADEILVASRAYAGDYPSAWQYPGRERIMFAAERDLHEGIRHACTVPALPPQARAGEHSGDRAGAEVDILYREIPLPGAP
jgi:hypothetical protein